MKNRKLWISVVACLLVVVLAFGLIAGAMPAMAAPSLSELEQQLADLKNEKKELDGKIGQLEGQLSDNLSDMEAIVAQKDTIDQEIFTLHSQMTNLNAQIATYNLLIADKQEELDKAQQRLADLTAKNKERIRAMEENGAVSYWSVLFKANNFADFLDRLNMVEEIASADRRRIQELRDAAAVVETAQAQLVKEKEALEASKEELNKTQQILDEKRAEADRLLAELVATGEEYQKLLEALEDEALVLSGEIDEAQDAYDDAKYQQWLSTSVPPTTAPPPSYDDSDVPSNVPSSTGWLVPCNYTRFSSPFGWRIHPVYGGRRFHYGVDLAAPSGTPIVASKAGTVTVATFSSSAGYYVAIDHGDGFSSKYLHMTHYIVSAGQYVEAGQVIGYVGSTGASTGPHLHFSILYNGAHVNPADYINI